MAVSAAIVGYVGYSIYNAEEGKKEQRHQDHLNRIEAGAQETELKENQRKADLTVERDKQKNKRNQTATAAQGRRSTIMTSPIGITGSPTLGGKELIGE